MVSGLEGFHCTHTNDQEAQSKYTSIIMILKQSKDVRNVLEILNNYSTYMEILRFVNNKIQYLLFQDVRITEYEF